ncbi:hypothetical protein M2451_002909 [Dysgonomonas sp. PFB1-18]|uniref:hypothetical protein n=1 Tax=unclassified Dysgonomonas TaxID=2630389 RepID=UPI0013D759EB|nr:MULTISPECIES: hypothetical protein [unclassified Dysgonomonas]MDH6310019.1 hypothetical protein [Dysgonomonas sp. PF1-14]MDH6339928.1 hypothetical protein [Dysgonomonas sp. PF1-16]MDH6381576.1 hypothetical protein [Dysgonomonas sp. PFB1-18]MDH6398787.1 hypothetical protein [Dysgonomonas sp. PF1-23]NDV93631.1 hypothetical protein [Dysgonomonas sp. 521]
MIITRKIQIYPIGTPEEKKVHWSTIFGWQDMTYRLANQIATHRYIQDGLIQMLYLEDGIKRKLADHKKDEFGILNTSNQNSTYEISKAFDKLPADIRTSVNQYVSNYYNKEKSEYFTGKRSLRNYKRTLPIPFPAKSMRRLQWNEEINNFEFVLFGISFRTLLGYDRSNNRIMIERCLSGEVRMCGNSIQIEEKKTFLLLKIDIPSQKVKLNPNNVTYAILGIDNPIIAANNEDNLYDDKKYLIGSKDEFFYQKKQIQEALRRAMQVARYNKGGKGRKRKMQSIDRFEKKEANYVNTKLHTYSKILVNYAKNNKSQKLVLIEQSKNEISEGELAILRNWSYFGLIEKIQYKAAYWGIEIEKK